MDEETDFLHTILTRGWDAYDSFLRQFEEQGKGPPAAIIGHAFFVAVQRRFGQQLDQGEVIKFVADTRANLAEEHELPAKEAEALVFAMLGINIAGAEETVDKLDIGEMAEVKAKLPLRLVEDAQLSKEQLDAFLLEAEDLLHDAHSRAPRDLVQRLRRTSGAERSRWTVRSTTNTAPPLECRKGHVFHRRERPPVPIEDLYTAPTQRH